MVIFYTYCNLYLDLFLLNLSQFHRFNRYLLAIYVIVIGDNLIGRNPRFLVYLIALRIDAVS